MDKAYSVLQYSVSALKKVLVENTKASEQTIDEKLHSVYFQNYFDELKAKTFILESEYIDHDFLEDFSNYYVKCFRKYKRKCVRLHFFAQQFSESDFEKFLNGTMSTLTENFLQESYIGFIVVKCLPRTIFGRTCLKTYDSDNGRRYFPPVREYEANLFGIQLRVESLAYQEQDSVVAACATSALWSVFHSTGRLFQHPILSPVEISESACASIPLETRYFPNHGLNPVQMAQAIRAIGLEPILIKAENQNILRAAAYSYLRCKIPMILGLQMIDVSGIQSGAAPQFLGLHAVALTGFSLGKTDPIPFGQTGFLSTASKIDKLYSHDDQVGPFSRMVLEHDQLLVGNGQNVTTIFTSWKGADNEIGSIRAVPTILSIPVYHKIRIPFNIIQETIIGFDEIVEKFRTSGTFKFNQRLHWDIHLTTVNEVKSGMLSSSKWRNRLRLQVLMESMPRFIWRATAFCGDDYVLDLLFDATDLEQSSFLVNAVGYHEAFYNSLMSLAHEPNLPPVLKSQQISRILEWFAEQDF